MQVDVSINQQEDAMKRQGRDEPSIGAGDCLRAVLIALGLVSLAMMLED